MDSVKDAAKVIREHRKMSSANNEYNVKKLRDRASNKVTEINKIGVTQGRDDLSEPKKRQYPILIDMDRKDSWICKAQSYAVDRRLKGQWKTVSQNQHIDIADIFGDVKDENQKVRKCTKVVILGAAGMGKSVLLRWLSMHGSLKDMLVLVPELRNFSSDDKVRPSFALLSNLFHYQDRKEMEIAFEWIKKNSSEVAIIIDSLDTMPFDLDEKRLKLDNDEETTIDVIAHNLLSGNLLPGSLVVSSSREYKVKNMHPSIQPDRFIMIDGLSEQSVEYLIRSFLGEEKGAKVVELIKNKFPHIWPMLTIPIVLMFTIMGHANDDDFIPSTMAAIQMNYFTNLTRSEHARVANVLSILCKLLPMCLHGIKEENVLFTPDHLKDFGVELRDALELGIFTSQTQSLSIKLMQSDGLFLYFSHQTQQEFLAALDVLLLETEEFELFVVVEFLKPKFIIVRRLVYGIALNATVLEEAENLLERRIPDIDAKKAILMRSIESSLVAALSRGEDRLLEVFIDLNEVEHGAAELIQSCVRKIDFSYCSSLKPSDIQAIASVMKQSKHLVEVNLLRCNIDERKADILFNTVAESTLKIDHFDVGYNNFGVQGSSSLAKLANHCSVKSFAASSCNLESEHLEIFHKDSASSRFSSLNFSGNSKISAEGWKIIGSLTQDHNGKLNAHSCALNDEKVKEFREGVGMSKFALLNVTENPGIGPNGWRNVGEMMEDNGGKLDVSYCHFNDEMVESLCEGMGDSKLRVLHLNMSTDISPKGWQFIGGVMEDHGAKLDASYCNLNDEKVEKLREGMGETKFNELHLFGNMGIGPEGWLNIGRLLENHCERLNAGECKFNDARVARFAEGMAESMVKIVDLFDVEFQPNYTPALLKILPRVEEELDILCWKASGDQVQDLQDKLNDISSTTLMVKVGELGNSRTLKAFDAIAECADGAKIPDNLAVRSDLVLMKSILQKEQFISCKEGGKIELWGCSIAFPPGLLKRDTVKTMTLGMENAPEFFEGSVQMTPSISCDLSDDEVVPGAELEVELTAFCVSAQPVPMVLLRNDCDSKNWIANRQMILGRDRKLKFRSPAFSTCYACVMRYHGFLRNINILAQTHLYRDEAGVIKFYTSVADESIINVIKTENAKNGLTLIPAQPQSINLKLRELIHLELQCTSGSGEEYAEVNDCPFFMSDDICESGFVLKCFKPHDGGRSVLPDSLVTSRASGKYRRLTVVFESGLPCDPQPDFLKRMKEEIAKSLESPSTTVGDIGTHGGEIKLNGCRLIFDQNAFDDATPVSFTVALKQDIAPDGLYGITPAVKCSTGGIKFRGLATIQLTTFCKVDDASIVVLCKKGGMNADWEKLDVTTRSENATISFQVPHFCWYKIFTRLFWPTPMKILLNNYLYYDIKTSSICALTCIRDDTMIQKSLDVLKKDGYRRKALAGHDNIQLLEDERMKYQIECDHPAESRIRPNEETRYLGSTFKHSPFEIKVFCLEPTPAVDIARIRYTLLRPKEEPKVSVLPLKWGVLQMQPKKTDAFTGDVTAFVKDIHIRHSTPACYNGHFRDDLIYQISPERKKGMVLIINNDFKKTREGSEVDVRNMKQLWEELGFETQKHLNLAAQEMRKTCQQFAGGCNNISIVVVVIMTHGGKRVDGKEYFLGEDDEQFLLEDLFALFSANTSPHIRGIPKVFLFQACRGLSQDHHQEQTDARGIHRHQGIYYSQRSDMLITYPTQPGYQAIRNTLHGSWLINAVTRVFMEHAHNTHLLDLLTRVNNAVAKKITPEQTIQISSQENYLTKNLYLFPGWPRLSV